MIRLKLKRYRLANTTLVVGLGAASGTAELGPAGQFVEQPGICHCAYLCIFACHDIHPLFRETGPPLSIIILVSSTNEQGQGAAYGHQAGWDRAADRATIKAWLN